MLPCPGIAGSGRRIQCICKASLQRFRSMTAVRKAPTAPATGALPATPPVQPAPCACVRRIARRSHERAARRPTASVQAHRAVAAGRARAASAFGAAPQAATQQHELEEAPSPAGLAVNAEYTFSVEGCCTLRVRSRLDGGTWGVKLSGGPTSAWMAGCYAACFTD